MSNNKKRKQRGKEEVGEEREGFLSPNCRVVEYLQPLMSKELLVKFPDNSDFDFNYSESSIWSPLVPRIHNYGGGFPSDSENRGERPRKRMKVKKMAVAGEVEAKTATSCNFSFGLTKMKKKKRKEGIMVDSVFSSNPVEGSVSCAPLATKGWNKVLKAATKHFKRSKTKTTKRRDPRVRLSNYLVKFPEEL
ncbi:unnamed protein product [Linum tenue]|uniref:Uncharacterized protein n=1 Tax=Linum tenue TaxID=586396 RepID=A0AAV0GN91_9ROSI|nr:unnamed protein product [Linum tenue]